MLARAALAALPLALLVAAANPGQPGQPGVATTRPPHHDFLERIRTSPLVVRGVVQGGPAANPKDTILPVHVDAWLKGEGPTNLKVDFGSLRPVTPEGHAEILFLTPANVDGGPETHRALQENSERWEIPDGATAATDQAIRDVMAGAPEARVLAALTVSGPVLGRQAATRLGLLASTSAAALPDAEAAARNPQTMPDARAELLRMLPSRLSMDALLLGADPSQPPPVRLAAVEALGQAGANDPTRRQAALPVLRAAASGNDLRLKLTGATGLARLGEAEALKPIDEVLASTEQPLRLEALHALLELVRKGNPEAEARLRALANDPDPQVKKEASALVQGLPPPAAPARSPALPLGIGAVVVIGVVAVLAMRRRGASSR